MELISGRHNLKGEHDACVRETPFQLPPLVTLASLSIPCGWWGKCHCPSDLMQVYYDHICGHSILTKQCSVQVAGLKVENGAKRPGIHL